MPDYTLECLDEHFIFFFGEGMHWISASMFIVFRNARDKRSLCSLVEGLKNVSAFVSTAEYQCLKQLTN